MTERKAVAYHDITLESDDTATPTTSVALMLAEDEAGKKRWREMRLPPFPFRYSQGEVQYAHKDPQRDLVFSQTDWSGGALTAYHKGENRYAKADGCDLRWPYVATLGMKKTVADFLLRNPGAELGATTGWTQGTGVTLTAPAGAARTGSYGFRIVTDGARAANDVLSSQALVNPTLYRDREITVIAFLRRTAGTSGSIKLAVTDDTDSTYSSTVTSATYTYVSVTKTINVASTTVTVAFAEGGTETGAMTYEVEDIAVIPTGGVVCGGTASDGGALYGIFGRCICQWDETNDRWNAVYINSATTLKSIHQYGGNLYAALSDGTAYVYGSTTSWTTSTILAPGQDANLFVVSRQTLWKGILASIDTTNHGVYSSTNPVNGGSWSSAYTIGTVDTDITGIYDIADTIAVGKTDGLYVYKRVYDDGSSADLFQNVTNEYKVNVSSNNFAKGKEFHGWLYLSVAQQGLLRFNGSQLEDISSLLFAPRLNDFGGMVRALSSGPVQLWLLGDTPTTDTTDAKTTWLMSLREVAGRGFLLHTIESVAIGDINWLEENNGYVWAFGRSYVTAGTIYQASIYRWTLPTKTVAPAYDISAVLNLTGSFDTSIMDFSLPDDQKAFIALTIFTEPSTLDAEHTIVAKFKIDAASSWTTLGTFSGSTAIQTKYFDTITTPETNAIGRSIQQQFTMSTDDTVSPKLYAFALHATLRPDRVKMWEAYVQIGDGLLMYNGQPETVSKATLLTNLSTLETQVYPIELTEDFDNDEATTTHRVQIVPGSFERVPQEERREGVEIYRLLLQEVTLA